MNKWVLAPFSNCERGATEQTADHIISQCSTLLEVLGISGLMILVDKTDVDSIALQSASDSSRLAVCDDKR